MYIFFYVRHFKYIMAINIFKARQGCSSKTKSVSDTRFRHVNSREANLLLSLSMVQYAWTGVRTFCYILIQIFHRACLNEKEKRQNKTAQKTK